ncbi:TRAP-type C4-dicarboxylate transport system, small permease component [Pseudovibrio sp. Tun.PSC04-5.I4]|nr:TRAP-type C4-dicarboxylate transport system, small permease component [Pseudovibrio sp. Tun.PSC04-5.I4]
MIIKIIRLVADRFEEFVCSVLLGYLALSLNFEVFIRYVLNSPSAYTDEIARIIMISIVFMGVPWAVKADRHVIIDLLPETTSPKVRLAFQLVSKLLFVVFCYLFILASSNAAEFHRMLETESEGLRLPYWMLISILPFSFSITIIRLLQSMYYCIINYNKAVTSKL